MSYRLLETISLQSNTSNFEFLSIPNAGQDLELKISAAHSGTSAEIAKLEVNGVAADYDTVFVRATTTDSAAPAPVVEGYGNTSYLEILVQSSNEADRFSNTAIHMNDYKSNAFKSATQETITVWDGSTANTIIGSHKIKITDPIESIKVTMTSNNFIAGTTASLYVITNE